MSKSMYSAYLLLPPEITEFKGVVKCNNIESFKLAQDFMFLHAKCELLLACVIFGVKDLNSYILMIQLILHKVSVIFKNVKVFENAIKKMLSYRNTNNSLGNSKSIETFSACVSHSKMLRLIR